MKKLFVIMAVAAALIALPLLGFASDPQEAIGEFKAVEARL